MHRYEVDVKDALGNMPFALRMNFPKDLAAVLVAMGVELDRLRAENIELRSKIEKE